MTEYTGQCLCGDIRYTISGSPAMAGVCHCKNCQRQAGSAFSTLWGIPKPNIAFDGLEPTMYEDGDTASGGQVERYFCGRCGSPLYSLIPDQQEMLFLKTGTLDQTDDFVPQFHVWCDSKQNWVDLAEEIPQMATQS